jgi:FHA domain-containing protein
VIKLTVQTYNGTPLPQPLSAQFDELGGSIGRADTNQLVLPDPERSISRVHAQVVFRNGAYVLVDRGSNPVLINGRSLGNGVESPLSAGDQLQIGGYAIRVDVLAGGASAGAHVGGGAADPFGDLGGMAFSAPAPSAPRPAAGGFAGAPAGGGRPPVGGAGSASTDPMAAFGFGGASPAPVGDPFGFNAPSSTPAAGGFGGGGGGFGGGFGAPAAPAPAASAPASGGIPDDWDPFAPDPVSAPKPQDLARSLGQGNSLGLELGGGANAPLIPGMGDLGGGKANTSSSIDAMFGLGGGGGDPLANSVLAQASAQPNMANHLDPMKSLNTVSVASATVAPDNVSALNQPFMEPPLKVNAPKGAPVAPVPPAAPAVGGAGSAVMSWDDGAQEGRTVIRSKAKLGDFDSFGTMGGVKPAAPAPARPAAPIPAPTAAPAASAGAGLDPLALLGGGGTALPASGGSVLDPLDFSDLGMGGGGSAASPLNDLLGGAAPAPAARAASMPAPAPVAAPVAPPIAAPVPAPVAAAAPSPVATSAAASGTPADQAALIAALREGLGMSTLPIQSLTPEFMKLLGQLVHESTKGTVELLVARAALKREIRAEVTMIVAKENNPLKFSPSVDVALNHLLSPPARGFMPPAPAMRDAYDDLRAHQFAFVAGMRAALEGVLKRFDPEVLEGKLTQKSVLASVLPGARKARMWDVFTELYSQISAEASDDFHELFGKEFLRAYEAHIDELQRDA